MDYKAEIRLRVPNGTNIDKVAQELVKAARRMDEVTEAELGPVNEVLGWPQGEPIPTN